MLLSSYITCSLLLVIFLRKVAFSQLIILLFAQTTMKRSLLKENRNTNKLKIGEPSQLANKDQKAVLPPIRLTLEQNAQKTLDGLVRGMQAYVLQHSGPASDVLRTCLQQLSYQSSDLNQSFDHPQAHVISTHKKPSKQPMLTEQAQQSQWGGRSQIMSIKRGQLRKVESRKLFEKMRHAKYDEVILRTDKEVIAALKGKIAEKEEEISGLNRKLEEWKSKSEEVQKNLIEERERIKLLEGKVTAADQENAQLSERVEELSKGLLTKTNEAQSLTTICENLKKALSDREQEITCLWQTYLSNSAICLL